MASLSLEEREPRLNLLVAFPYLARTDMMPVIVEQQHRLRLLIDSGAFTAWKAGKAIAVDDYCRFLESLPVRPWRYFTLDVIGDPAGTLRNYEVMLARGFKPIPIFTRGEDPSVLEEYYRTSDVVGIGGLVGTRGNRGFVNGIMRRVAGRRCHWLGFTALDYLKHYRPYMCDSSSWEMGCRYGQLSLYAGNGKNVRVSRATFIRPPPPEVAAVVRSYGYEPAELAMKAAWYGGASPNRRLCGASGTRTSLDVQRHLGVLLFRAATTSHSIKCLLDGLTYDLEGKRQFYGIGGRDHHGKDARHSLGRSGQRDAGVSPAG